MKGHNMPTPNRIMSEMYINSVNCVILVVALTLIILIYVVFIGLYCLMSGCGVVNYVKKICALFTSKLVKAILQIISYTVIGLTFSCNMSADPSSSPCSNPEDHTISDRYLEGPVSADVEDKSEEKENNLNLEFFHSQYFRFLMCGLGVVYLMYSSCYAFIWFNSTKYPSNCFSPSQLKTFLNRIKTSDKLCTIRVRGRQHCPPGPWTKSLYKDFAPHLWTETCELIDISGMRPNRIESAYGLSDILEEFLSEKKVFILDIGLALEPEDTLSLRNTNKFVSKVLETASTLFESTASANFCVSIPALARDVTVETKIPIKDGTIDIESERLKLQMHGPRLTCLIHRELDLPAFWYFIWKHRNLLMVISTFLPTFGLFFQHLLEDVWQRHNLDIVHKYSFVPQTDPPYQMDKSFPEVPDVGFTYPHKITILLPSERFLLPRDSLGKIITGQMDLRQSRPLHRVSSTESSPPILTPHTSRMGDLLERAEEYRRSHSRGSTSSEGEKLTPPPSYTAVFETEMEGLTPPPDYTRARAREGGASLSGETSPHFFHEV